jgi:hypothetical protein
MAWVIPDPEVQPDQMGDPLGRPDLASEPIGFRPRSQEMRQMLYLLRREFGGTSRGTTAPQRLNPTNASTSTPLAYRTWGDAKGLGNGFLLPALLLQGPGAPSSPLTPIKPCFMMLHAPIYHV